MSSHLELMKDLGKRAEMVLSFEYDKLGAKLRYISFAF